LDLFKKIDIYPFNVVSKGQEMLSK